MCPRRRPARISTPRPPPPLWRASPRSGLRCRIASCAQPSQQAAPPCHGRVHPAAGVLGCGLWAHSHTGRRRRLGAPPPKSGHGRLGGGGGGGRGKVEPARYSPRAGLQSPGVWARADPPPDPRCDGPPKEPLQCDRCRSLPCGSHAQPGADPLDDLVDGSRDDLLRRRGFCRASLRGAVPVRYVYLPRKWGEMRGRSIKISFFAAPFRLELRFQQELRSS